MASTNLTREQVLEAERQLAKHLYPGAGSSETSSMTEEQKNLAFETAMRVVGGMCGALGAPSHQEMRETALGVIAAAAAAADKLKAIGISSKP